MLSYRYACICLFAVVLLLSAGCANKGIPCPKPSKNKSLVKSIGGGKDFESVSVPTDKNGRVKKRKKLLF
ncbi:hypothetical protein [Pontibacter arcticus]|uniref:Lipoprotein n=1 Tax=Pontibacter arcticus TaxID=2080288 RepID=A0A364RJH5_9BACT|nr:hypothetical protein [Pontibacter arcticus]RAU84441.1 hypothetical protein DP923_05255 [Pontibacter arcticus]